jgi:phospholipid/cholesterol/gamma-HCH transport system substrate-binding protein
MTTRTQKIKLGLFIVLSALVIGGLLAVFLGIGIAPRTRYYVFTDDAEGLDVSVPVKLRGVRVGRVTELELMTEGRPGVRVEVQVDRDTAIHADARAYFELAGVSGLKLINIRDGTPKAPRLPPGSEIPAGETTLDKLSTQGEQLLARASKVLDSTDRLLAGLNKTTEKLASDEVDRTLKDTQKLVSELGRTATELNRMVAESRQPLRRTLLATDQMAQRTDKVLENLNLTILELRGVVRQNDGDVRATMDNLREASRSFKTLSQELRRRPNRLLFGGAPAEREFP